MKTETREVYKCDYCNKMYQRKHSAIYHESICGKNPANHRPCHMCVHICKKETFIYSGSDNYYNSEPINAKVEFLFCNAKQIFLYTPKNEARGNYKHIDENGNNFENNPMPKTCADFSNDPAGFISFLKS